MPNYVQVVSEELQAWCKSKNEALSEQQIQRFAAFVALLDMYNKKTNLIGITQIDTIMRDLILDSLEILTLSPLKAPLLDVGSGAGFPGIPIKIMRPDLAIYLVEPNPKRNAFLKIAERSLDLKTIGIHQCRIEDFPQIRIGTIISKAFTTLPNWLKLAESWLEKDSEAACLCSLKDWEAFGISWLRKNESFSLASSKVVGERFYGILRKVQQP